MSTSRGPDGGKAGSDPRTTRPVGGKTSAGGDPAALPRILAETVDAFSSADEDIPWHAVLTEDDRRRLLAVVRSRSGQTALDLAIAADLVAAVLPQALAAMADGPLAQRRLVEQIARSLLDDPQSAERLQALLGALIRQTRSTGESP